MKATDDVPGRLKIDDATVYDTAYSLHIGSDRILAGRGNLGLVDAEAVLTRGSFGSVFKADPATVRDAAMQLRVGPNSAWVKRWRS